MHDTTREHYGGASGYLTIDLAALARNYRRLSAEVTPGRAAAVVKADAYGLGVDRIAPALHAEGCRYFFVAHFVEAMRLEPHLPEDATLFVLNGLQPGNEKTAAERGIIPVINSPEQWHQWADAAKALGRTLPAVLQFDTGMSRLGLPPEDRRQLASLMAAESGIDVLFLMSHLACAEDVESGQNEEQLAEMTKIAAEFPELPVCFANSGGTFPRKKHITACSPVPASRSMAARQPLAARTRWSRW